MSWFKDRFLDGLGNTIIDDWGDVPRNKQGHAKLVVDDRTADRWIAAGAATEDDLIRSKPIPASVSVFQSPRRCGKSYAGLLLERREELRRMTPAEFRRQYFGEFPIDEPPKKRAR